MTGIISHDFKVTPLTGTTGAELRGIDLRDELTDDQVAAIHQHLVTHKVIFFPGQHLNTEEHIAFSRRMGEPTNAHPIDPGHEGHDELHEIDYTAIRQQYLERLKEPQRLRKPRGDGWHTDVTFVADPPSVSILNALAMPEYGGDTVWANTEAAYEGLSAPIRHLVDELLAVHDGEEAFGEGLRKLGEARWNEDVFTEFTPVEHPVVRTHPVSGKRALWVNPEFTQYIKGVSKRESDAILSLLYQHMVDQKFLVRYHWKTGDVGLWDNRATMHYVVVDYGREHRLIQRVTLRGDRPFGPATTGA